MLISGANVDSYDYTLNFVKSKGKRSCRWLDVVVEIFMENEPPAAVASPLSNGELEGADTRE